MTADAFRRAALAMEGAIEGEHMRHPDFRVGGRIFASLAYPDTSWGMVKLPVEEQARLVEAWPEAFQPAAGAWGRQGSTAVRLAKARTEVVAGALEVAWEAARSQPVRRRKLV